MSSKAFVFGVDLDGTVADFYGGLRPVAAEWLGRRTEDLTLEVSWGLPEWGVDKAPGGYIDLHKFAVTQRELFRNLEPFPDAAQTLRMLSKEGVRIRIITHRLFIKFFHHVAIQQTVSWLDHHGIPYWDLCFMSDKAAVGSDLYIEDSPDNVRKLRADGHPTLVYSNSTNRHLDGPRAENWRQVGEMVTTQFYAWKAAHHDEGELAGQ
jgi:hypothetical protein